MPLTIDVQEASAKDHDDSARRRDPEPQRGPRISRPTIRRPAPRRADGSVVSAHLSYTPDAGLLYDRTILRHLWKTRSIYLARPVDLPARIAAQVVATTG